MGKIFKFQFIVLFPRNPVGNAVLSVPSAKRNIYCTIV